MRRQPKLSGLNAHYGTFLRPSKTNPSCDKKKFRLAFDSLFNSSDLYSEDPTEHFCIIAPELHKFPKHRRQIMDAKNPALNAEEYDGERYVVSLGVYENGKFFKVFPNDFYLSRKKDISDALVIEDFGLGLDSTLILDGEVIKQGGNYK